MTELETTTTPAVLSPLELALAKQSVSAVAVALVNQNGRETTLQEIADAVAHFQPDAKKVYASVQTLATHGKVARGIAKNTYAPAGSIDQAARAEAKAAAAAVKPKTERAAKAGKEPARTYTNEEVFGELLKKFGEPREFVVGETWGPTHVLLGDASAQYMIDCATRALGADPTAWTLTKIGPNDAVMFLA